MYAQIDLKCQLGLDFDPRTALCRLVALENPARPNRGGTSFA